MKRRIEQSLRCRSISILINEELPPRTWTKRESPGYGILIVFALGLVLLCIGGSKAEATTAFPVLSGRVVDNANLLSEGVEKKLAEKLSRHEANTSDQVVVLTMNTLNGQDIADFGTQLGRHWGIGQKDKNNGALLIVVSGDRKVRIEVGYGLEERLTDAASHQIIQADILPAFRGGDYARGIENGVDAILGVIQGDPSRDSYQSGKKGSSDSFFLFVMIGFFLLLQTNRSGRSWKKSLVVAGPVSALSWFWSGNMLFSLALGGVFLGLYFLMSFLPKGLADPHHGNGMGHRGRGGGFGNGGGFGGGGFGGGGGGFGGGGSSGGW